MRRISSTLTFHWGSWERFREIRWSSSPAGVTDGCVLALLSWYQAVCWDFSGFSGPSGPLPFPAGTLSVVGRAGGDGLGTWWLTAASNLSCSIQTPVIVPSACKQPACSANTAGDLPYPKDTSDKHTRSRKLCLPHRRASRPGFWCFFPTRGPFIHPSYSRVFFVLFIAFIGVTLVNTII